jgi:hypothetical protein
MFENGFRVGAPVNGCENNTFIVWLKGFRLEIIGLDQVDWVGVSRFGLQVASSKLVYLSGQS